LAILGKRADSALLYAEEVIKMKITKVRLKEIIYEELAESDLGPWRAAFEKVPRGERLNPVESELVKLAAGLKRLGIGDDELDDLLQPLTTAVEANVEGELGLEEKANQAHQRRAALVSPNAGGLSWRDDDSSEESEGLSYEDELGVTEPRFEASSPEGKLINKLLIHAKVEGAHSPEEAAALLGLGNDEEVIDYIGSLMGNQMYGSSGMGESKVSGHRSEVTYSKSKRGKSKKLQKKAYNKADRAQSKRDVKKDQD
jgi:hypothetical protein